MGLMRAILSTSDADAARRISGLLGEAVEPLALAVTLFEEPATRGWTVDAYYETEPDRGLLDALIAEAAGSAAVALRIIAVPDENWVAVSQAALPPVHAGAFLVHGSHDRAVGLGRPKAIEIDAGEAFGTAHHATTLGCLLEIDRLSHVGRFRRALDLGCGSGVLAIAMAKSMPDTAILASDNDPQATAVARANVRNNGAAPRVRVVTAPGIDHALLRRPHSFDLIVANILAGPLIVMAPRIARAVARGGTLVLSGILESQAAEVLAAYAAAGMIRSRVRMLNGWATLTLSPRG